MEPLYIEGSHLTRVDRPTPGLHALSLGASRVLLIGAGPPRRKAAWSLVPKRPRGDPADGPVRGLRERLEGGKITRFLLTREGLYLEVLQRELRWQVVADGSGLSCRPAEDLPVEGEPASAEAIKAAWIRGEGLLVEQQRLRIEAARAEASALLRTARERLKKRAAAVERDLLAAATSEERATFAALFVPAAAAARPGQTELRAVDWSTGEAREVSFPLAPDRPARLQLDALFARARRLRLAAAAVQRRRDDALLGVMMIDDALEALPAAGDEAAVKALLRGLAADFPGDIRLLPPSAQQGTSSPGPRCYRRYEGAGGHPILVGRDASSNDELTLKVAHPRDLWVHARGHAGAHVIVPSWNVGASELLIDAATLAAHFSEARGEDRVEVQYTPRKHLRKRRGAAPGVGFRGPLASRWGRRCGPARQAPALSSRSPLLPPWGWCTWRSSSPQGGAVWFPGGPGARVQAAVLLREPTALAPPAQRAPPAGLAGPTPGPARPERGLVLDQRSSMRARTLLR